MGFKQAPGRSAFPKTGKGLSPNLMCGSPMKQTDPRSGITKSAAGKVIDKTFSENSKKVAAEALAQSDSTSTAKAALVLGKSKKMAGRAGNLAANETRKKNNVPTVIQGRYTSGSQGDAYWRTAKVEKDVPNKVAKAYRQ